MSHYSLVSDLTIVRGIMHREKVRFVCLQEARPLVPSWGVGWSFWCVEGVTVRNVGLGVIWRSVAKMRVVMLSENFTFSSE